MSKQSEIREGIDDILWELAEGEITILETKQKLSDLGVVIKVDRDIDLDVPNPLGLLEYLDECGYVAVESLIKKGVNDARRESSTTKD